MINIISDVMDSGEVMRTLDIMTIIIIIIVAAVVDADTTTIVGLLVYKI